MSVQFSTERWKKAEILTVNFSVDRKSVELYGGYVGMQMEYLRFFSVVLLAFLWENCI